MLMVPMKTPLCITVLPRCLAPTISSLATMGAVSTKTGSAIMTTIVGTGQMRVNSVTQGINSALKTNLPVKTSSVLENNFNAMDRTIVGITLMKLGVVSFLFFFFKS